jgi:hypothetical protein
MAKDLDQSSRITQEWFAEKPTQIAGQLELDAQPQEELPKKETDTASKPLTPAEVVARRLRGAG